MWIDVYALCEARSAEVVERFRSRWAAGMHEASADYALVASGGWTTDVEAAIAELTAGRGDDTIYWTAATGQRRAALLAFCGDGALIAGVSLDIEDVAIAGEELAALCASLGARYGFCCVESPPPVSQAAFLSEVAAAVPPRMVDGCFETGGGG
jgi:hypothetical protein